MHPVSVSSHLATAYIKSAFPVEERKKVEKGHQSGCDTCVGRPGLPHPLWPPNERERADEIDSRHHDRSDLCHGFFYFVF